MMGEQVDSRGRPGFTVQPRPGGSSGPGSESAPEKAELGAASPPLLQMGGITKRFPGVVALDGVDFELRAGEIHALLGENGAGKSTLIKVLTGVHAAEGGEILLDGAAVAPRSPREAQSLGISTVYQEVNLVPYLSVAENIFLGREPTGWSGSPGGRLAGWKPIRWRRVREGAAEALRRLDVRIDVRRPLNAFSLAIQQMVAIARALLVRCRILILDEPTSSLDADEVTRLFATMRGLRADGLGIVFVTHFLGQVYEVSDRLTVLRNGRLVATRPVSEVDRLQLVSMMIGKDAATLQRAARGAAAVAGESDSAPGDTARTEGGAFFEARRIGRRGVLDAMDVRVERGEVLGLAGLLGSGRTELARLLFGIDRRDSGDVRIDGRMARIRSPRDAVAWGLGLCPEDRRTEGIAPNLSVADNIVLALQARRGWLRRMSHRAQRQLAERFIASLGIATPSADKPAGELSGGNQQKVILARWLAAEPSLLILDEPTRGIDIGAKAEIERLVAELRDRGLAIIFISAELDEVVRTSGRVVVLRERRKVGELVGDEISVAQIMRRIAAHTDDE